MKNHDASAIVGCAPGRVNLMGEHTDYNDGFVLPMPIPQQTQVSLTRRKGTTIKLVSTRAAATGFYEYGREARRGDWVDYGQGVTWALIRSGQQLGGFEAVIQSDVPIGAGLSSSAAFEVALLRALRTAFGLSLSDLELARIAQTAEVEFVGVPVGLMDQLAASLGTQGRALFIDMKSLETRDIAIPEAFEVLVINSGVSHQHGTGDYRKRRSECEAAAKLLGVASLREVDKQAVTALRQEVTLAKRVRHVVTENERVLRTVEALQAEDAHALKRLFADSHASLRDDYEVSAREVDTLIELGMAHRDVFAARMTGGGFGGAVVMLARRGTGIDAAHTIAQRYGEKTGRTPQILLPW